MTEPTNLHDAIKGNLTRRQDTADAAPNRVARAAHREAVAARAQELRIEQEARAQNAGTATGIHTPGFRDTVAAHFTKHTK